MDDSVKNYTDKTLQEPLHFLQVLIDAIPTPIFYKDTEGLYLGCNEAFEDCIGIKREELVGKKVYDLAPTTLADIYHYMDMFLFDRQQVQVYESTVMYADGTERNVIFYKAPFYTKNSKLGGLIGVIFDITECKLIEEKLKKLKETQEEIEFNNTILKLQQDVSPYAILIVDENAKIISYNQQFVDLWRLSPEMVGARDDSPVLDAVVAQVKEQEAFVSRVKYLYEHRTETSQEEILLKDGRIIDRYSNPIVGTDGKYYGRFWQFHDITERKETEQLIRNFAFNDTLTGLPNRRLFHDRLEQAMITSSRTDLYGAVIFMDLDNFKSLNDTYGHDIGDLLLVEVSHRIKKCIRKMDTVARLGGDEFIVLLSELKKDMNHSVTDAGVVAEKIRIALAEPYLLDDGESTVEHHCTASIGLSLFINQKHSKENIIKFSDMAMYQAKASGRNLVVIYDSDSDTYKIYE